MKRLQFSATLLQSLKCLRPVIMLGLESRLTGKGFWSLL